MSRNKTTRWPQWLTGFTVSLSVLTAGLSNGWTSPYLAQLTMPDIETPLKLTNTEASWVASFLNLGRCGGSIIGAIVQGTIGRKKTLLAAMLPLAFGWVCTMIAKSVTWLYVARIFCGIGSAMIWTTLSLFIGEIADPSIRGSLIFLNTNAAMVGAMMATAIGPYLPMEQFGYVSLTIIAVFVGLFVLIPDSPYHYVLKDDMENAKKSLRWFHREADVSKEIQEIKDFLAGTNVSLARRLREFVKMNNLKNAFIMFMLNVFLYSAGHNIMGYYAEIIIRKSEVNLTPSTVVIAVSLCTVIAGATATVFVDKLGRRCLLIVSSLGTSLSLIALGIHFHLMSLNYEPAELTWLPVSSLLLYHFSITCGMIPVPNALMSELFPPILKTLASMFFSGTSALLSFMTTRSFQPLVDVIDEKYVFWIFAFGAFTTAPYTYFCIPETKGKTLVEIQIQQKTMKPIEETINNNDIKSRY